MPAPVNTEEKKELKKFINENGFFLNIDSVEEVKEDSIEELVNGLEDATRTTAVLPKGENANVMVFRGLASQKYGKGEKNRNGYKYDVNGFDLKNYKKNPLVLLQHNREMPIGKTLSLNITENGLEILYYVDFNTKAGKEYEHEIRSGLIGMLSTGAITNDWGIEDNKTGKVMSRAEAKEKGISLWDVLWGESVDYTLIITSAELIENSQVTIGSNEGANTKPDSLFRFFENQLQKIEPRKNEKEEKPEKEPSDEDEPESPVNGDADTEEPENGDEESKKDELKKEDKLLLMSEMQNALMENQKSLATATADAKDAIQILANTVISQNAEIKALKKRLDALPSIGTLKLTNQISEKKEGNLTSALRGLIR